MLTTSWTKSAEQSLPCDWIIARAAELDAGGTDPRYPDNLGRRLRLLGFEWLCYHRFGFAGGRAVSAVCIDDHSPPGWSKTYFSNALFRIDPRLAFTRHYEIPWVWDRASLSCGNDASRDTGAGAARTSQFSASAIKANLGSGVTIGLPDPYERTHVVVTASARDPSATWISDRAIGAVHVLASELYECFRSYGIAPERPDDKPLSLKHRKVLALLVRGMTQREIERRLCLAPREAESQIRELIKLCRVRNRIQLAYVAGRLARLRAQRLLDAYV